MVSGLSFTKMASRHAASIAAYIEGKFGFDAAEKFGKLMLVSLNALQANPELGSPSTRVRRRSEICNSQALRFVLSAYYCRRYDSDFRGLGHSTEPGQKQILAFI